MRRRLSALLLVVPLLAMVTGCSDEELVPAPLTTTSRPGPDGLRYIEGAVQEFQLIEADGDTIESDAGPGSADPTWSSLPDGVNR